MTTDSTPLNEIIFEDNKRKAAALAVAFRHIILFHTGELTTETSKAVPAALALLAGYALGKVCFNTKDLELGEESSTELMLNMARSVASSRNIISPEPEATP